jgi:flagellar biosynthesis GTPase FlhF
VSTALQEKAVDMSLGKPKSRKEQLRLKNKEEGFQMGNLNVVKLREYNSLHDPNMRHFFENQKVQGHLYKTGQIDRHGRVIDLDRNKSKIHILEREFSRAEAVEEQRQKDELEMRYRVQRKRFEELERVRKDEILQKLKHDRMLSKEIITTMRSSSSTAPKPLKRSPPKAITSGMSADLAEGSLVGYGQQEVFLSDSLAEG